MRALRVLVCRCNRSWAGRLAASVLALSFAGCSPARFREDVEARNLVATGLFARAEYARALEVAQQSLGLAEQNLGADHKLVASTLRLLSAIRVARGEPERALVDARRAVEIEEEERGRNSPMTAVALIQLASVLSAISDYAGAENGLLRTLKIFEKRLGADHIAVGVTSYRLAVIYYQLGDLRGAARWGERAIGIIRPQAGRAAADVGEVLSGLAMLYGRMGEYEEAGELHAEALRILEREHGPEDVAVANALERWAKLYRENGYLDEAKQLSVRALAIQQESLGEENPWLALSQYGLAEVYREMGDYARAEPLYTRAIALADGSQLPRLEWVVYGGYARLLAETERREAAIYFGKRSINLLQTVRLKIRDMANPLRTYFVEDNRGHYERLADWLIEEGRLPEAQVILAMLKEAEYFEFIERGTSVSKGPSQTLTGFNEAERSTEAVYRESTVGIGRLAGELEELSSRRTFAPESFGAADREKLERTRRQLRAAREAFSERLASIANSLRLEGREEDLGEMQIATLRALRGTLSRLGPGTVLIHYLVAEDRVHAILTTSTVQLVRSTAISRADLNRQIHDFRMALTDPRLRNPRPTGAALYVSLIKPLRDDLEEAGARTLLVSLDGALRYVPLAALWDSGRERYLVEDFSVVMYLEAARQSLERAPSETWHAAGFGITGETSGYPPLYGVRSEVEAIVRHGDSDGAGILDGEIYLDGAFSLAQLSDVLKLRYPVVHIASHFVFNPGTDAASFLVMGNGTKLTLSEMRAQDIGFDSVDLLTLSACETAMATGGDGQEIEGFGALAIHHGAAGVLATLWRVEDITTAYFMPQFYRVKDMTNSTKAAALREVQLMFLRGDAASEIERVASSSRGEEPPAEDPGISLDRRSYGGYVHPYFWAPFVLLGNWL